MEYPSLAAIFEGWEGYECSLAHTVEPLTPEQLAWRPAPHLRSVGELARHISIGRLDWFERMGAPGSAELAVEAAAVPSMDALAADAAALVHWLEASWHMIELTLATWTLADLAQTYRQAYQGQTYAVSRQWTVWRILAHDLHHGGELALMLGQQGLAVPELGDLGGHLTLPPLAPT